jgi:hypothetical protein
MKNKNSTPLPRWKCLNKRDAAKLIEWTNTKLDEEHAITEMFIQLGEFTRLNTLTPLAVGGQPFTLTPTLEYALESYRDTGDLTLLQQADPKYAEYLSRKRGRRPNPKDDDPIWQAVRDVMLIRRIWKEHFDKFYRSRTDKVVVTAEQIAADRWHVDDLDAIGDRLKKLKKNPL